MQNKIYMAQFEDAFALPFLKGITIGKKNKKKKYGFVFVVLATDNF